MPYNYSKLDYLEDSKKFSDNEISELHGFAVSTLKRWKTQQWNLKGHNRKPGSGRKKTGHELPCLVCSKPVYHELSKIKQGFRKTCSRACARNSPQKISKLKAVDKSYMQTDEYSASLRRPYRNELDEYRKDVIRFTKRTYNDNIDLINPNRHPRGRCGEPGAYQLDHIVSIKEGFLQGIPPEEIASVKNLQMLPWRVNLLKSSGELLS